MTARKLMTAALLTAAGWLVASNTMLIGQEAKKPKGRLPFYYGDIVTPEQREKIYAIQASYDAQRTKLEEQLEALKDKEGKEIESVLSPAQKTKLKAAVEEAAAKRKKKTDDKKAATEGGADKAAPKKTK